MRMRRGLGGRRDLAGIRLHDLDMTDRANRRAIAGTHAGRAHNAHA